MRILLLNDYATPSGGAELMTRMLRDGLRAQSHDVRVLASSARPGPGPSFADSACFGTTTPLRALLEVANPFAVHRLRRELATFRPDVVHVRMMLTQLSPAILPLLRGVRCLYHAVWYRAVCPTGTKRLPDGSACTYRAGRACLRAGCLPLVKWAPTAVQRTLWRRWRGVFGAIVANSESVRQRLLEDGFEDVQVIRNGVDVAPARPPLGDPPLVAFAGRLVPEKGAGVLLRAFARIAPQHAKARLLLCGDGPQRRALEREAAALGVASRCTFAGHVPRTDLERLLAPAWVQAVPSTWDEPFGLVAAEAMMRGTAVIAGDRGGPAEIVGHGATGLLVPPGDVDALAGALAALLGDRARAERLGAAARTRALAELTLQRCVARFAALYEDLRAR